MVYTISLENESTVVYTISLESGGTVVYTISLESEGTVVYTRTWRVSEQWFIQPAPPEQWWKQWQGFIQSGTHEELNDFDPPSACHVFYSIKPTMRSLFFFTGGGDRWIAHNLLLFEAPALTPRARAGQWCVNGVDCIRKRGAYM